MENPIVASLEQDLLEIERECGSNGDLTVFMREYRSLFDQLRKTEDSVKRINANNRELQAEILSNDAKLPFANRIMTNSENNINELKHNVENALTEVLKAQSVEKEKKMEVKTLQKQIQDLGVQLDANIEGVHKKQPSLDKLLLEKSELAGSVNEELEQVARLRDAIQGAIEEHDKLEEERENLHLEAEKLTEELQVKEADIASMENRRDKLKENLDWAEQSSDRTEEDIQEKKRLLKEYELNIERIRRQNGDQKIMREKIAYEIDVLSAKYFNLQDNCKIQYAKLDELTALLKAKTEEVKEIDQETETYKEQIQKVDKICEVLRSKIDDAEKKKIDIEMEKRKVRDEQLAVEAEQSEHNRRIQLGKKDIKKTQVEDRRIKKDKAVELQRTKDKTLKLDKSELNQQLLQEQIEEHKSVYASQFQENAKTDKQRLDYMGKAMQFQDGYLKILEKDKKLEDSIVDLKKNLMSQENQEKCVKNMCDAVRNDINLANRTMLELRTDMVEMKQDMQTKLTEVEQLKHEVDRLSSLVKQEEKEAKGVEDFNYVIKNQIQEEQHLNKVIKENCANQNEDYHRMIRTMGEIQFERAKQESELQKIVTERNLLDKQIISRNMELKDLYEKMKLQTSVLTKGERSYMEKEAEAEKLKQEVKKLIQERSMWRKKGDGAKAIRDQIESTRKELTRSRHACRVMEDEVQIPINVHRWRSLQGSDPSTYALIEKLQGINQRYLRVCAELSEKHALLQLQEKLYIEMKFAITKQPGPEVSEQISVYQSVLKEKAKQLKAMKEECKMFESQEQDYKTEIQSLIRELAHVKKKFFTQVAIDEKHAKMGRKAASEGMRPKTTTPRELTPRDLNDTKQPASAVSKGVKFAEDPTGQQGPEEETADPETEIEEGQNDESPGNLAGDNHTVPENNEASENVGGSEPVFEAEPNPEVNPGEQPETTGDNEHEQLNDPGNPDEQQPVDKNGPVEESKEDVESK